MKQPFDFRLQFLNTCCSEFLCRAVNNLTIDKDHTFSVGPDSLLEHNTGECDPPKIVFGKSISDLSNTTRIPDRNGLTVAGRSLTKHSARKRSGRVLFLKAIGNAAQINEQAHVIFDEILNDSATTLSQGFRGRFGDTIEAIAPDGRAIIFDINGKFLFFKE